MTFTCGSLFTGIGGIDLAFVAAGFDILFQVEIDDFCRKVLEKHEREYWPNATRFTDIRDVGGHNLPEVDVLFGGFPCQDLSVAGKRLGITEGTRSGLWFEFARVIGDLRPRVVLLENVPGILTRDGTIVIADLAKMGYVGQWGAISAADVGAPHKRERWLCVAYRTNERVNRRQRFEANDAKGDRSGAGKVRSISNGRVVQLVNAATQRLPLPQQAGQQADQAQNRTGLDNRPERSGELGNATKQRPKGQRAEGQQVPAAHGGSALSCRAGGDGKVRQLEPGLCRGTHGLSAGVDRHQWPARPGQPQHEWEPPRTTSATANRTARLKALGNAVVPQVVYPIAQSICEWLTEQDAALEMTV